MPGDLSSAGLVHLPPRGLGRSVEGASFWVGVTPPPLSPPAPQEVVLSGFPSVTQQGSACTFSRGDCGSYCRLGISQQVHRKPLEDGVLEKWVQLLLRLMCEACW